MRDKILESELHQSLRSHLRVSLIAIAVLVGGFGGWSVLAGISGAVIGPGLVVVETSTKKVQHSEGGIVKQISVRDGDRVDAGDLLIELDGTIVRANLQIVRAQMDQLAGLQARLEAESLGAEAISWPQRLTDGKHRAEIAAIMDGQAALLASRHASNEGRRTQLAEQIRQIKTQVEGLAAQRDAKADEIEIIDGELADLKLLRSQGHVTVTRINELSRQRTRLHGEYGGLVSDIARAEETISERRIQILQIVDEFNAGVLEELQETRSEISQLAEREIAALDRLARIEIRSPRAGIVHNLAVNTIGGVIGPGETVLEIVPRQDSLVIEARIAPADVDQVQVRQQAGVRFPGLDRRTTPELSARIVTVSPDLVRDEETRSVYYKARLILEPGEVEKLGAEALVPGMPVETFIKTSERSVFSYFVKPMTDQIAHAFRED